VVFNKIDLLDQKLSTFSTFTDQCPNYTGEKTRAGVCTYIEKKLREKIPEGYDDKYFTFYPCCALDQSLMKKVFEEAKAHLTMQYASAGLYL